MDFMRRAPIMLALALAAACSTPTASSVLGDIPGADASALAGTYTGVLIRGTGSNNGNVTFEGTVTVTATSPVEINLASSAFPTISATVISFGQKAVNLNWVSGTNANPDVQLVDFYKDAAGSWLLVIETGAMNDASSLAIDYASYDPALTQPTTNAEALAYFNDALQSAQAAGGQ
jgi:hypothetical protein